MNRAVFSTQRAAPPYLSKMTSGHDSSRSVLAASTTLTGAVVGLGLLGLFLDRKFETAPYLLLAGLLVGAIVGLYDIWKAMFPSRGDT